MSVQIDNISTTTIGNAIVGTAPLGSSSILAASTAFVRNYFDSLNLVINGLGATISGIKTFTNALTINNGFTSGTTSFGTTNATTVDIAPLTSGAVSIAGITQPIQSPTSNSWSIPIVIAPSFAPLGTIPYTKILSGTATIANTGTQVNFPIPFTAGCVPRVWICTIAATGANAGAYDVTNSSFKSNTTIASTTASWFALGY